MNDARFMEVLSPGLSSTFQDLGRTGHQHLGVPVSGVMDEVSHRLANWLVGNPDEEPTLEITFSGPVLRFGAPARIAVTGAEMSAEIVSADGRSKVLDLDHAVDVDAGELLKFGRRLFGARCYLATRGGFAITPVMGSGSTYTRGRFGGFKGRALDKGDVVPLPPLSDPSRLRDRCATTRHMISALVAELDPAPVRVTRGLEWDLFGEQARRRLFESRARIGPQSDRMGYRLAGIELSRADGAGRDILSQAVAFGSIQVPNDGAPIVLMADRQSTGGYPRIAQVVTVDLPRLSQMLPGDPIRFELMELEEARALLYERSERYAQLRSRLLGTPSVFSSNLD